MNKKLLRSQIELNNVLLPVLVVFSILICGLYMIHGDLFVILYSGIFLLTPFLLFAAYKFINNMFVYVVLHILFLVLVYFLSGFLTGYEDLRYVFSFIAIIFIFISIYKKTEIILPKPTTFGYIPTIAIIVPFYVSNNLDTYIIPIVIAVIMGIYLLLCLYNHYLVETYVFCSTAADECIPSFLKSKTTINKMWKLYIIITIIIMVGASFIPSLGVFNLIGKGIKFVLGDFLSGIKPYESELGDLYATPSPKATVAPTLPPSDQNSVTKLDLNPLFIVLVAFSVIFIIVLIVCLILPSHDLKLKKPDEDDTTYLNPFEKQDSTKIKRKKFSALFGSSVDQKIRKIFFKIITENIDERLNVKGSLTTEQLCNITFEQVNRDTLLEMKKIYDKARYSSEKCTKDDLNRMKELEKRIK